MSLVPARLALLALAALLIAGCPSATVEEYDAAPDASIGAEAGPVDAAAPLPDATTSADDASTSADDATAPDDDATTPAGDATTPADAGSGPGCPAGPQHLMAGTVQNPQTVTFGAGLPTERTADLHGVYLASFGPTGCFEWLARLSSTFLLGSHLTHDAQGNVYFGVTAPLSVAFYDADDRLVLTYTGTVATSTSVRPVTRGVLIGSYDRTGHLRWVEHIGNAAIAPNDKGYDVESLQITDGVLRVIGTVNGGTRGNTTPYEMVFGRGQPGETRVQLANAHQAGYIADYAPATGTLAAGSVRIDATRLGATNQQLRHDGDSAGIAAADGDFATSVIMLGAGQYWLNRGQRDERAIDVTGPSLVAAFTHRTRAGGLAWHRTAGANTGQMALFSTAIVPDGSTFFSGNSEEGSEFETGAGVVATRPGTRGYLVRYDDAGNLVWLRGIAGRGLGQMLTDAPNNALYAIGQDSTDVTFGVGDADAVTRLVTGPYVARFALDTGALVWLRSIESSGGFINLVLRGDELVLGTTFQGNTTFDGDTAMPVTVSAGASFWSGHARYATADGAFRGAVHYVSHPGLGRNGMSALVVLDR